MADDSTTFSSEQSFPVIPCDFFLSAMLQAAETLGQNFRDYWSPYGPIVSSGRVGHCPKCGSPVVRVGHWGPLVNMEKIDPEIDLFQVDLLSAHDCEDHESI